MLVSMQLYCRNLLSSLQLLVVITLLGSIGIFFISWGLYLSVIPYIILLAFMSFKEGPELFGPNLLIVKSFPVDKRKVAINITNVMLGFLIITMGVIIFNMILAYNLRKLPDISIYRLVSLLAAVMFPIVISSVFLLLPNTIDKPKNGQNAQVNIGAFILVIFGLILALFLLTYHWMVIIVVSIILYTIAVKITLIAKTKITLYLEQSIDI